MTTQLTSAPESAGGHRGDVVRRARSAGRARNRSVTAVLVLSVLVVGCLSVGLGRQWVPPLDVVRALSGTGPADARLLVLDVRLPRVVVGLLAGAAFGLAGAIFQSLTRNVLASPDVIGVTTGASTAAVVCIVVVGTGAAVPFAALVGGGVMALAIYLLAYRRGASTYRLVLVGIGLGAAASALNTLLLTRARLSDAVAATVWLTGTLSGRGWEQAGWVLIAMLVAAPSVVASLRALRALQLDDDLATGTGVSVGRHRGVLLLAGVVLAAGATAAVGPIPFVAFLAPPIARRLVRSPLTLVPSMLVGALVVASADLLGRYLLPVALPVGVVTGLIGAPYLLWLLRRSRLPGGER